MVVGAAAASERPYVSPHENMRFIRPKAIAVVALIGSAGVGIALQGWVGAFLFPLGLFAFALLLGIAWFVIDVFITYARHRAVVDGIKAQVRSLTNDQLSDLARNHLDRRSGFARVELMRRGLDARPPLEQVFEMLTSGNSAACGQAMSYVGMFYPEMRALVPTGSSNQDPREVWQSRVAAVRGAG